jgi:outer membrane protein
VKNNNDWSNKRSRKTRNRPAVFDRIFDTFCTYAECGVMKAIVGIFLVAFVSNAYASSLSSLASEALLADAMFQGAEAARRAGIEKAPQGRARLLPQIGVQQVMYRNGMP